jgi:hypothetical protein
VPYLWVINQDPIFGITKKRFDLGLWRSAIARAARVFSPSETEFAPVGGSIPTRSLRSRVDSGDSARGWAVSSGGRTAPGEFW